MQALLSETVLVYLTALTVGTAIGFFYGVLPGIGGRIGIILSLPIATLFDPYAAAVFLFALHAVVHTGTSIPAIAFGLPSTGADVATVVDGYPLAKMGRAGEALGASLSASAIGGVLGAVAFLVAIPIARPLVTSFGPPEFLVLALFGLTMVASLSREGLLPGLVIGCLGILAAMVGNSTTTGEARFTFGSLDLWDGVELSALVSGLFVIPEMLSRERKEDPEAQKRAVTTSVADVVRGMLITFAHMRVLLRSTLYGIVIGLTPAVGSTVSVWLSYGYAAQTTKSDVPFGKGAIAGVIAPEAANNSKEGGAMVPTLFFAIPGSSSMAIMMAALAYVGISVGPDLLGPQIDLTYTLALTIFLSNVLAIPAFFLVVPHLVRLSALRRQQIAPIAIALSITAALIASPRLSTLMMIAAAAVLGIMLKWAGWPRAPFVLGLVIGRLGEQSFHQTAAIWGWSALQRPITALLLVGLVVWVVYVVRTRPIARFPGTRRSVLTVCGLLFCIMTAAVIGSLSLSNIARAVPLAASVVAIALCGLIVLGLRRSPEGNKPDTVIEHLGPVAAFVALVPIAGLLAASFGFVTYVLTSTGVRLHKALIASLSLVVAQVLLLSLLFDIMIEKEVVGRVLWYALGF